MRLLNATSCFVLLWWLVSAATLACSGATFHRRRSLCKQLSTTTLLCEQLLFAGRMVVLRLSTRVQTSWVLNTVYNWFWWWFQFGSATAERRMSNSMPFVLLILLLSVLRYSSAEEAFHVRKHLSTVSRSLFFLFNRLIQQIKCSFATFYFSCSETFYHVFFFFFCMSVEMNWIVCLNLLCRYGAAKDIADNNFVPSKIPKGCVPIHLNLVVIVSTIWVWVLIDCEECFTAHFNCCNFHKCHTYCYILFLCLNAVCLHEKCRTVLNEGLECVGCYDWDLIVLNCLVGW